MSAKKRDWTPVKEMLFTYLAINKILYWISIVSAADGLAGAGQAVLHRLLGRDIVLILFIVFMYFFEYKFVLKQKKWNGIFAQIILGFGGYVMYSVTLLAYLWTLGLIFSTPFDIIGFLSTSMLYWTAIFFIVMVAMIVKEHFQKKGAHKYALNIQSAEIKLEMLEALLDDGALSQEEFDKQKVKLLGV